MARYSVQHQINRGIIQVDAHGLLDSDQANAAWEPMRAQAPANPALANRRHRVAVAGQRIQAQADQLAVTKLQQKHVERSEVIEATNIVVGNAFAEIARLPDAGVAALAAELECEPAVAKAILQDVHDAVMEELGDYPEELKKILAGL